MPTIAPWLNVNPLDYLRAAQAGAGLGLERARMAQQGSLERARLGQAGSEASGRLGLGYAQLGAEQQRTAAQMKLAAEKEAYDRLLAQHSMDLATRRADTQDSAAKSLTDFRNSSLEMRDRALTDQENKNAAGVPKTANDVSNYYRQALAGEEDSALNKLASGRNPIDVFQDHPTLLKYPPFAAKYMPLLRGALAKQQAGAGAASISKLASERTRLQGDMDRTLDLPEGTRTALTDRIAQIDEMLAGQNAEAGVDESGAPAEAATAAPAAAGGGRVKVQDKDGNLFTVPESQLEQATAAGYSRAE